ncbi:hypothetical protein CR162_00065 [Pseudoroseomonas rhizosphaerae]|uniref:Uncharacterized protein n=1 Tax=Teichococcus rhizosphaerae TaxID=1335062 RepID=A0A2C7AEH5_9PROT|nr:DUF6152 family protein [Pseudoroseomonas rhizosphaerae]PHK96810.1 hypothetical protein CR162_00065 [Pseudoroseomonas rhizosphaerae]
MAARRLLPNLAGGLAMTVLGASGAAAHHGWSWAESEQMELRGTVREVFIGPPHPTLRVEAADGVLWVVELGNPSQTRRAGFTEGSVRVGDGVTALGNRAREGDEKRMKAVRLRTASRSYDIYPERIRGD